MATCCIPAKEEEYESTMGPNWLELPIDITANILQRLGTVEIVTSACHVCPLWWKICKDPLMWRTIHITNPRNTPYSHEDLEKICRFAIKRSCGHLIHIDIAYSATDDLLEFIAENANLRRLRLARSRKISNKGFIEAVRKLPKLEELDISHPDLLSDTLEVIGRSCPLLKSFKFDNSFKASWHCSDEVGFVIAETMQGLHHFDISGNRLSSEGLFAILDSCLLLESLQLERCVSISFTSSLRKSCLEQIKSVRLPAEFVEYSCDENEASDGLPDQFVDYSYDENESSLRLPYPCFA